MATPIEVVLTGCHAEPLGGYLKALGVLRVVAEQADPAARGWWRGDDFVLRSTLDRAALVDFFAERYAPSPIVVPWGGAGGFFFRSDAGTGARDVETDATRSLAAIEQSAAPRLGELRRTIAACRSVLSAASLSEAPTEEAKQQLIGRLRSQLSDGAVAWMDASVFMTTERLAFPPLLGTGGNDGNLNFAKQLMGILPDLMDLETGAGTARARGWVDAALFETPVAGLEAMSTAQFDPGGWAGSANGGVGFDGAPRVSPWDFVLLLEGTLIFAAAATRRAEALGPSMFAVPFTVRPRAVDYASSSIAEEGATRAEMWLPLWTTPAGLPEVRALFAEGRARVGSRPAESATDFARAVAGLGVDRGIRAFARYGFHVRNGRMYLASPLGRWDVRPNPDVELLGGPLDEWLDRFRRMATGAQAPASLARAARGVDRAIVKLCRGQRPESVLDVLAALGQAEAALSRSLSHVLGQAFVLAPIPLLEPRWLEAARSESSEVRLAMALAAAGYRERMTRVRLRGRLPVWQKEDDGRSTWRASDLERSLVATLLREEVERSRGDLPIALPRVYAPLADVARFIDGSTDDAHIEALLRGLALIDWSAVPPARVAPAVAGPLPSPSWLLFALCRGGHDAAGVALPHTPGLVARAAAGDASGATRLAVRRLRGAGLVVPFDELDEPSRRLRRVVAGLAFPIAPADLGALTPILVPNRAEEDSATATSKEISA